MQFACDDKERVCEAGDLAADVAHILGWTVTVDERRGLAVAAASEKKEGRVEHEVPASVERVWSVVCEEDGSAK